MDSLNLLFVHEIEYTTKVIYEVHEFPENLAHLGDKVTFIEFPETARKPNFYRQGRRRFINGRVVKQSTIELLSPFVLGIGSLDRLLATITFVPLLFGLLKHRKFDAIVLYAVPTFGWQTVIIANWFKVPVIYRALDVSHKIRQSFWEKPILLAEKFVYKRADIVSANNPAMARYCKSLGGSRVDVVVDLPPLDRRDFETNDSAEVTRGDLGLRLSDSVLLYLGSFFYFSGLPAVIKNLASQVPSKPNLKLVLVGGGEQDGELRQLVSHFGLEGRVIFTGFIDYKRLSGYLKLADVLINPMEPNLVSNTAFPHKVLQYMAARRPIISTRLDGLFETFGPESGIFWVSSPEEVVAKCESVLEHGNEVRAAVKKQDKLVETVLDLPMAISKFRRTIDDGIRAKSA